MPKSTLFDKEQVLQNALETFWQKGYHGTSMQDLVDTTGLNRSSIYNSFGDKFGLYVATLDYYSQIQSRQTQKVMVGSDSALEVIRNLVMGNMQYSKKQPGGCFWVSCTAEFADSDTKVEKMVIENKERMLRLLTNLIEQAQEEGDLAKTLDAGKAALYLFSSIQGMRLTSLTESDPQKMNALAEHIIKSL